VKTKTEKDSTLLNAHSEKRMGDSFTEHETRMDELQKTLEQLEKEVEDLENENREKEYSQRKNRQKLELMKVADTIEKYDTEMK
jgi:cell division protein FtsB